jgi:hypothetical protein
MASENQVVLAFSLSKMTIADEMEDFDKYNRMVLVEFYEFVGRWAYLIFKQSNLPFPKKLEQLLRIVLPIVNYSFK